MTNFDLFDSPVLVFSFVAIVESAVVFDAWYISIWNASKLETVIGISFISLPIPSLLFHQLVLFCNFRKTLRQAWCTSRIISTVKRTPGKVKLSWTRTTLISSFAMMEHRRNSTQKWPSEPSLKLSFPRRWRTFLRVRYWLQNFEMHNTICNQDILILLYLKNCGLTNVSFASVTLILRKSPKSNWVMSSGVSRKAFPSSSRIMKL